MSTVSEDEIKAVRGLVREFVGSADMSDDELVDLPWTSHQTLDIIFGVEEMFALQFSSGQMEAIHSIETMLLAIDAVRAEQGLSSV